MQPRTSMPKAESARSSLSPPRLTNLGGVLRDNSSPLRTLAPARVTGDPLTSTSAAMINACARDRFSTRPRSTSASSRRRRARASPDRPGDPLSVNPGPEWRALDVADSDGQSIGRVVGMGYGRQTQDQPHHLLDLRFICFSVADHGLFDF